MRNYELGLLINAHLHFEMAVSICKCLFPYRNNRFHMQMLCFHIEMAVSIRKCSVSILKWPFPYANNPFPYRNNRFNTQIPCFNIEMAVSIRKCSVSISKWPFQYVNGCFNIGMAISIRIRLFQNLA
jgi:hypothetical protein